MTKEKTEVFSCPKCNKLVMEEEKREIFVDGKRVYVHSICKTKLETVTHPEVMSDSYD